VTGHAPRGEALETLKSRLAAVAGQLDVVVDVTPLDPAHCRPVEQLAPAIRRNRETGGVALRTSRATVMAGEPLSLDLQGIEGRRHVLVDVFGTDGSVRHLPFEGEVVARADRGRLRLGGRGEWPMAGPAGPRLAVVTVSDAALDVGRRGDSSDAGEYLGRLRRAIERAGDGAYAEIASFQVRIAKVSSTADGVAKPRPSSSQSPTGAPDPRCRRIVERGQLGEPLSDADRTFLRNSCR
jgi:hypothetical protein